MDDDIISSLPEHVKHRILSLIPNIKETARTGSLSKSWLRTWRSFPITDFEPWIWLMRDIVASRPENEYGDGFVRFVDDALMRSRDGMPRFRLSAIAKMAPHVDRWLSMVLDIHVEVLSLYMFRFFDFPDDVPYSIPERVLSAEFIKSLTLGGVTIDGISAVSLPYLQSLHLAHCRIDNQMFQRLLEGCLLLESLTLTSCSLLGEIEVSNLSYLKSVTVVSTGPVIKVISIKAPALETFRLTCHFHPELDAGDLVVHVSSSVKVLEITGLYERDEWFRRLLSGFPLLESLTLKRCRLLRNIHVSNPLLEKISIENCNLLVDVGIDTPRLSSFYYETLTTLPSIWTDNPPQCCAVGLRFLFLEDPGALWFEELQEFLDGCFTTFGCFGSTLHLHEWNKEKEEEMKGKIVLSTPGILHLKLAFDFETSEATYPVILDGSLSTCQPTTFVLWTTSPLRKFICEMLANREENPECCPGDIKCWKHELQDVKIERLEGTQHRGLVDWHTLFSLLPTLSTSNGVCFRLQWSD